MADVHIDARNSHPDIKRAYRRMVKGNGKGDAPRHIWSREYRENYDLIFGKAKHGKENAKPTA